ncbi:phospholipid/glycerol acyltransferase [Desulfatibacillum aliphaticivorans]|uniref:Phospholipid/glycerol acyltransferase n=2 Tax=Desulfatibacillum aliphaticivorans TaxID=218208 RepID=B8FGG6_DESAL|nr:phospholipid/glycerol acyltransferase [Desulfatibacillum aliphaticivorans]
MITDPSKDRFFAKWKRRCISITLYFLLWGLMTGTLPLILIIVGVMDWLRPLRKFGARFRCILFFVLYLNCEILGLAAAFLIWLFSGVWLGRNRRFFVKANYALQSFWASALLKGAFFIFSVKLKTEGAECAFPGPMVLMIRHASTADTVLASVLVAKSFKMRLRFVLKQELLWDPCLDVVGNRIPNVFVQRDGKTTDRELAAIKDLSKDLSSRDGILIYPEGTRFQQHKLEKIQKRFKEQETPVISSMAAKFTHVLPPRIGGFSAITEAAPDADIVVCVHTGFEGSANFSEFWQGALIGKTVKVAFWRIPACEIPSGRQERRIWLFSEWMKVDEWVAQNFSGV